jgi:8-oxo-dGTP pyrophosphatase MutT (NUDIX family)
VVDLIFRHRQKGRSMSLLDRVRALQAHDPSHFRPFLIGDARVGWIKHAFADRLRAFPKVFEVGGEQVRLANRLADFDSRSAGVGEVLVALRDGGEIEGWRNEDYGVTTAFDRPALMKVERAGVPFLGTRSYGVHLNGFVGEGEAMRLWVGRRAKDKAVAPGKLDHLVAGGMPYGLTLRETLVKECEEEASLPESLARRARAAGLLAYRMETDKGIRDDVIFCYDLEVPWDFQPENRDGEIESFELWPIARVRQAIADTEDFKFNVGPVIVDFMMRHGLLDPQAPDYVATAVALRRPDAA